MYDWVVLQTPVSSASQMRHFGHKLMMGLCVCTAHQLPENVRPLDLSHLVALTVPALLQPRAIQHALFSVIRYVLTRFDQTVLHLTHGECTVHSQAFTLNWLSQNLIG